MRIKTTKSTINTDSTVPGLLTGHVKYTIKEAESNLKWTGPYISPPMWHAILAFFKKTYKDTKSECQVRLYCNITNGTWAAWAYPQSLNTGMTTREIDNDDAKTQRAQFAENDGWVYLGTVHHHCSGCAFQSGTDTFNEQSQDGLHVTIGKLDEEHYDIHARFYLDGNEFAPDLSKFWDVGDFVRSNLPPELWDAAARWQMTMPAPAATEFPIAWTQNLIEPPKVEYPGFSHGGVSGGAAANRTNGASGSQYDGLPLIKRRENALKMVRGLCMTQSISDADLLGVMQMIHSDPVFDVLQRACLQHRCDVFDIEIEYNWDKDIQDSLAAQGMLGGCMD